MLTFAANIESLVPYQPGKPVAALERELGIRKAVKLASNESPLGASPSAILAAAEALSSGHRYPEQHDLRAALARHLNVATDELCLGSGSSELIDLLCRALSGVSGEVVHPEPSFVCYRSSSVAANLPRREVPLRDHLHYDAETFVEAISQRTRLVFIANPNNPTGGYMGREALSRVLRAIPEEAIVVVDEAYVEYADAADFVSALTLRDLHPHLIVLRTFSKAYGLAALRVGYAVGPSSLIAYLERLRPPFNVSTPALAAAEAALADSDHLQRSIDHNTRERARVRARLEAMGVVVAPSQANFLLVDLGPHVAGAYEQLLRRGVIVRPMGPPIARWLRISLGLTEENDLMLHSVQSLLSISTDAL